MFVVSHYNLETPIKNRFFRDRVVRISLMLFWLGLLKLNNRKYIKSTSMYDVILVASLKFILVVQNS